VSVFGALARGAAGHETLAGEALRGR
jgi:hypothetical protein